MIAGPTGGGASNFYMYNLSTGTAVLVGQINGGTPLDDTAVVPVPEPAGLALLCVDASGVLGCRASNQID